LGGIAGFLLLLYGLTGLPGLSMSLPPPVPFKSAKPAADIFLGFMLILGAFAWGRSDADRPGLGWFSSKLWFWVILAAAAWIRLSHYTDPPALYWMDYAMSMVDARSALDFPEERYFIFPHGSRQPLYQYLAVLAYHFFPDAPAFMLQNILWGLIDLIAVWIHYLLGKEVGGRRVGLILAALMALSKPVLVNSMTGQSPITGPLGVGLILLFTFRFLRKTDSTHALQWGAALAFGAYCYIPVRMYLWIAPMALLAVALWKSRVSPHKGMLGTLVVGMALVWTTLYFTTNKFIKPIAETLHLPGGDLIPRLLLLLLLFLALKAWNKSSTDPGARTLSRVVLGMVAAGALAAPIATHPLFSEWSYRWSIFWPKHPLLPPEGLTWHFVYTQFQNTFSTIFKTMMDRGDMSLPGEAFFNLQSEALVLVGLAYALCRWSWRSTFLIACVLVCTVPHAFSFMGHTARLIGVVSPLFLLAALATDAFLGNLRRFRGGPLWTALAVVGLASLGLWAYRTADYRFYTLLPQHAGNNVTIFNQVRQDVAKYRVYLIQEGTMAAFYDQTPLVDNYLDLYAMGFPKGSAPVPVKPGEKTPDVAIYVSNNYPDIRARIQDEFPNVRFEDLHSRYEPPGTTKAFMYRAYIPGDDIQYIRQKHNPRMFYKVDVPDRAWRRRFYFHHYGLGKGVIQAEDWVTDPESKLPIENAVRPVEITGTLRLPKDGKYKFSVESWNYAVVHVGKHRVLNLRGVGGKPLTDSSVLRLKAGDYPVRFQTYFQAGFAVPPVKVLVPGESEERSLGSLGS
jgi:F0F1-type ATP synthase assembly protein I